MSFFGGIQQYQNNTASNTQTLNNVKETARPVSVQAQAQELIPGKVFEGTITEMKNGLVTIGLSDGKSISARMEANVSLEKGQPMLFEVKANTGEQIAIRPVTLESAQNPTLLKALEAAGLKVDQRNLSMVNQMMMEQLPIDKNSLMQMARAIHNFPQADMQTLVQMQKSGLMITEDSLNQFQNYKNGQQAILPDMNTLMEGLAKLPEQMFGKEGAGVNGGFTENIVLNQGNVDTSQAAMQDPAAGKIMGFQQQLMEILFGEGTQSGQEAAGQETQTAQGSLTGQEAQLSSSNPVALNLLSGDMKGEAVLLQNEAAAAGSAAEAGSAAGQTAEAGSAAEAGSMAGQTAEAGSMAGQTAEAGSATGQMAEAGNAAGQTNVGSILTGEGQSNLTSLLQEIPGAMQNEQLLPNGQLNPSLSAGEMLQQIMKSVEESKNLSGDVLKKLFFSKDYKGLLKQAMMEQWTLTPEQLKEDGAVKELYQRLSRQMAQMQQALSQAGKEGAALAKTAHSVQSNLEFMNQLNQAYTYVQLPLKLQNQNAHSDLYVYTNKKNLRDKNGELTALLHLDMEHLGSTDIYVKLKGTAVHTDFYLEDDASYRLIAGYTNALTERLEQKGYQCEVNVENRRKEQDFVQDFLEQEKPAGKLHRYSFDVKA